MKQYLPTIAFYILGLAVVYILNLVSPGQHDGGPGFGALALVILVLTSVVLALINLFRGIRSDKSRLVIVGIHLIALIAMLMTFFI